MLDSGINVPLKWEHMNSPPICSHLGGTLKPWVVYTRGRYQFHKDENDTYHYKNYDFKIKNNWFLSDEVQVKLPQRTKISTFERVALSLGMTIGSERDIDAELDIVAIPFKKVMHILTTMALKDLSIIKNNFQQAKQLKYGEIIFETYYKSTFGSGNISAKHFTIRWLNEQDTLQLKSKLFVTSSLRQYQVGLYSMEYKPTVIADNIFKIVFTLLKALDFKQTDISLEPLDFVVSIELLELIRLHDVMMILNNCIGYDNGFIIRPIVKDDQHSRVYSVFSSIGSQSRKLLGFTNYDIGSAMQTICLHLVKDRACYPLHQELTLDKQKFRYKVAVETNKDILWVKKELSKIDNLDKMPASYNQYPTLKVYFDEAQILRQEIIEGAEKTLIMRAKEYAKVSWTKVWNKDKKAYDYLPCGKKEVSIFFFVWTQWERLIRESMMSCFNIPSACHQVHDAVYSKENIETSLIEKKVLTETGFNIKISKE